jgi:hypothetical protein
MSGFVVSVVSNLLIVCIFFAAAVLLTVGMLGLH